MPRPPRQDPPRPPKVSRRITHVKQNKHALEIKPEAKPEITYTPIIKVSVLDFWKAYHYLTEPIIARTSIAPLYTEDEIEANCEIQRRLYELMSRGVIRVVVSDDDVVVIDSAIESFELQMRGYKITR